MAILLELVDLGFVIDEGSRQRLLGFPIHEASYIHGSVMFMSRVLSCHGGLGTAYSLKSPTWIFMVLAWERWGVERGD